MSQKSLLNRLSLIMFVIGIFSPLFYPRVAHKTYLSENALMPGYTGLPFPDSKEIMDSQNNSLSCVAISDHFRTFGVQNPTDWLIQLLRSLGLEAYRQQFTIGNVHGENVYGILRATRGQGIEALALSTTFDTSFVGLPGTCSSLAYAITIFRILKSKEWRAKDFILIVSDKKHEEIGLKAWIDSYHHVTTDLVEPVKHCGALHGAIHLDFVPFVEFSRVVIHIEGLNGQLPNLDLINVLAHVGRSTARLDPSNELDGKSVGSQGSLALDSNPFFAWTGFPTLFTLMWNQAVGVPTGAHGFWIKYHVDAVTLRLQMDRRLKVAPQQLGNLVISSFRSLNNILEHLHQSFYFYLLPSPVFYVSIGEYMVSLGLILGGLGLKILITILNFKYDDRVLHSLAVVCALHLVGLVNFLFPLVFHGWSLTAFAVNIISSLFGMKIVPMINRFFSEPLASETFFATLMVPAMMFVLTQSLLNFSFCFFSGIVIVFLSALVRPSSFKLLQILPLILLHPLTLISGFSFVTQISIANIYQALVSQFLTYGNLTYSFLFLVYQPFILCLSVLSQLKY